MKSKIYGVFGVPPGLGFQECSYKSFFMFLDVFLAMLPGTARIPYVISLFFVRQPKLCIYTFKDCFTNTLLKVLEQCSWKNICLPFLHLGPNETRHYLLGFLQTCHYPLFSPWVAYDFMVLWICSGGHPNTDFLQGSQALPVDHSSVEFYHGLSWYPRFLPPLLTQSLWITGLPSLFLFPYFTFSPFLKPWSHLAHHLRQYVVVFHSQGL